MNATNDERTAGTMEETQGRNHAEDQDQDHDQDYEKGQGNSEAARDGAANETGKGQDLDQGSRIKLMKRPGVADGSRHVVCLGGEVASQQLTDPAVIRRRATGPACGIDLDHDLNLDPYLVPGFVPCIQGHAEPPATGAGCRGEIPELSYSLPAAGGKSSAQLFDYEDITSMIKTSSVGYLGDCRPVWGGENGESGWLVCPPICFWLFAYVIKTSSRYVAYEILATTKFVYQCGEEVENYRNNRS
jgi:hypothetical protein